MKKYHVEARTNSRADVCTADGRVFASVSFATEAVERANLICALLNDYCTEKSDWVVTSKTLSGMFREIEGVNKDAWGYHHAKGWNDALRQAMDYTQPPVNRRAS